MPSRPEAGRSECCKTKLQLDFINFEAVVKICPKIDNILQLFLPITILKIYYIFRKNMPQCVEYSFGKGKMPPTARKGCINLGQN